MRVLDIFIKLWIYIPYWIIVTTCLLYMVNNSNSGSTWQERTNHVAQIRLQQLQYRIENLETILGKEI